LRAIGLLAVMTAAGITAATADEMFAPRVSRAAVEWDEVAAKLTDTAGQEGSEPVQHLNRLTGKLFANIAASPVPVLLPFNTADLLRDHTEGKAQELSAYLAGFRPPTFFQTGPAGYDAAFTVYAREMPDSGVHYSERITVHISGSALLYEVEEPAGVLGWPVKGGIDAEIPGLKRSFLEQQTRYTFVRFGVPYVVAIECQDGAAAFRRMSCRDADKVATHFLKALQVAGGSPGMESGPVDPQTVDRPDTTSTVFTYHAPGDLLPGSGMKGRSGRADYTVYSKMRFPLADAPAFANSQSFMNWGDCDQTGRVSMGRRGDAAAYRCRVNSMPLIADESANYAYPWRDNFCEHRFFWVGQCPGGLGHQGQDIRPSSCKQRGPGANRCEPYQHDVVAVRDGMVLRAPGQASVYIVTNAPNEHVRFRYLHMFPKHLDQEGILSGRAVHEGEVIGKVGNYFRRERATTYHLHFDMQVPTKYGWVFVNPYISLVAAYERQIQGRGQELQSDGTPSMSPSAGSGPASPVIAPALELEQATEAVPIADAREPADIVVVPPTVTAASGSGGSANAAVAAAEGLAPIPAPAGRPASFLPAAAVNPVEIDIQLEAIKRIASETAGDDRKLSVEP